MSIKYLNKTEITELLADFRGGDLDEKYIEKLFRFAEFNTQIFEDRIAILWGKESMVSLYIDFISVFEAAFKNSRDIRLMNVLLKLSATQFYKKLLKSGSVKNSYDDILNGEVA